MASDNSFHSEDVPLRTNWADQVSKDQYKQDIVLKEELKQNSISSFNSSVVKLGASALSWGSSILVFTGLWHLADAVSKDEDKNKHVIKAAINLAGGVVTSVLGRAVEGASRSSNTAKKYGALLKQLDNREHETGRTS